MGARRGRRGPSAAGGSGRAIGSAARLGGGGSGERGVARAPRPSKPGGWEPGGRAAGRAAGAPRGSGWAGSPARRLRREPEPERSQSSDIRAPANTCDRPPGPAGGSAGRRAGGGAGGGAILAPPSRAPGHVGRGPAPAPASRSLGRERSTRGSSSRATRGFRMYPWEWRRVPASRER